MMAYRDGDVRAFEVLVRRHRGPVFNFIFRLVRQREKAEDLLQDTFLRIAKNAGTYQQSAKFTTWMYTIARNLCIDELRRASHRQHASLDAPMGGEEDRAPLGDSVAGKELDPDRGADASRMAPIIVEALQTLPEEQREVFVLREYAGVPFKDIAAITETPVGTVKSRMRYALEGLRAALEARGVTPESLWDEGAAQGVGAS